MGVRPCHTPMNMRTPIYIQAPVYMYRCIHKAFPHMYIYVCVPLYIRIPVYSYPIYRNTPYI